MCHDFSYGIPSIKIKISNYSYQWIEQITVGSYSNSSEAAGIALVLSQMPKPYVISFVIGADGRLLDGTELNLAINGIDGRVQRPPLFFMVNCVYPNHFHSALEIVEKRDPAAIGRILGFQANTSSRSHDELDGMKETETEDPHIFAEKMGLLYRRFGTKILGGCCGTDDTHIKVMEKYKSTKIAQDFSSYSRLTKGRIWTYVTFGTTQKMS